MPNIKSQKKRAITNLKENAAHKAQKSALKTSIKNVLKAVEANDKAAAVFPLFPQVLPTFCNRREVGEKPGRSREFFSSETLDFTAFFAHYSCSRHLTSRFLYDDYQPR